MFLNIHYNYSATMVKLGYLIKDYLKKLKDPYAI